MAGYARTYQVGLTAQRWSPFPVPTIPVQSNFIDTPNAITAIPMITSKHVMFVAG